MMSDSTVARAFELARGGTCRSIDQIRSQLKKEGYSNIPEHLNGPLIKKQLGAEIKNVLGKS